MSAIVFRADGDSHIGLGHLIRSSALAEMLKDDYHCILVTRCSMETLLRELKTTFTEIVRLPETDYLQEAKAFDSVASNENLVVLDGYNFDDAYQQELFSRGFDMFSIDDIHASPFYSKVIINHSGGITPMDYRSLPGTQFYLGPQYALLRKPFLQAAKNKRYAVADNNCFLCFGGADPENHTMQVLQSQKQTNHFSHFHVVVGKAYQFKEELDLFAHEENITVHFAVSPQEIVTIMQQCSFAICSPSTIVYEYLSVGGIVFLKQIADNQKDVIRYFMGEGMAFSLGQLGQLSEKDINGSFAKQAVYFDGGSGERYKKIFLRYFESKNISIRPVNKDDLELCYQWANDEAVRAQSYNQSPIPLAAHTSWFNNKLNDACSYFYILEYNEEPAGQIRFQVSGSEAMLGYLAGSSIRAKGFGTTLLAKGIEAFTRDYGKPLEIIGYVKKTNLASQRSFERLAFKKEETNIYPDSYKYTMNYGN